MNPARLQSLAALYGANVRRWPAADREAAQAALDSGDAALRAALHAAEPLDTLLDGYRVDAPSRELMDRILAGAPRPARMWSGARLWWAGLAGVGVTGAALGALAVAAMAPVLPGNPLGDEAHLTAFGDIGFELGLDASPGDDIEGLLE